MTDSDDKAWIAELTSLIDNGQKIEAIQKYRERTSVGLAEAKSAIEQIADRMSGAGQPLDNRPDVPAGTADGEVLDLMRTGQKIAAIKRYRETHGGGLKEAKEAVEALAAAHGIESKSGNGCAAVLALLIVVTVTGLMW
jgi:ribosomal protein L7/L12